MKGVVIIIDNEQTDTVWMYSDIQSAAVKIKEDDELYGILMDDPQSLLVLENTIDTLVFEDGALSEANMQAGRDVRQELLKLL